MHSHRSTVKRSSMHTKARRGFCSILYVINHWWYLFMAIQSENPFRWPQKKRYPDLERCKSYQGPLVPGSCKHAEDRNHGVLLAGCSLLTALLEVNPSYIKEFRRYIPALVRALRSAVSVSGYAGLLQFRTEKRKKNPRLSLLCSYTRPYPLLIVLAEFRQTEKPTDVNVLSLATRNMVTSGYTNAAEYDIAGASFVHIGYPLVEHHPYI